MTEPNAVPMTAKNLNQSNMRVNTRLSIRLTTMTLTA
jgi:hypothetical protein